MCLQCTAEAELVKSDVLPGYSLYRATKNTSRWPRGWFGLVSSNDPAFVFKGPLLNDPCAGLTEDDLDAMPEYPEGYDEFCTVANELSRVKIDNLIDAHRFVEACRAAGFDPAVHGTQLGYWLLPILAEKVLAEA